MAYGVKTMSTRRRRAALARMKWGLGAVSVVVAVTVAAFGCGGGDSGVSESKLPQGLRSQTIEHEPCDESGKVETLDANNDGKPDIKRVTKDGHEVCRITDLNHDGKPDMFEYYDAAGQLRRREADYDDNGVVNSIEYYENGKLVRRELDTSNQGKLDTWDFFDPATGKRIKRERDSTGDGRIDQWWTYDGDKVTIAMDRDGDGKPDPDSTVDLGGGAASTSDAGVATSEAGVPVSTDGGSPAAVGAAAGDGGPSTPALTMPSLNEPSSAGPALTVPDAGVAGKPQRGGAKR